MVASAPDPRCVIARKPRFLVPRGARWDCRGCAKCCHHHDLGPVEPEIAAGIEAHGIDKLWPGHEGRPWATRRSGPTGTGLFLEKIDGHCVFLQDDGGCAVHAAMGAAAKPAFCREYPFMVLKEPRGYAITLREGCGGVAESMDDGALLEDQAAEVLALPRHYPMVEFSSKRVELVPGLQVPRRRWLELEEALLADIADHDRQPADHVAAVRARVFSAVGRPDPAPSATRLAQATAAVLQVYGMVLDSLLADDGATPAELGFTRRLHGNVARARSMLTLGRPALDQSGRRFASLVLRNYILGKRFQLDGSLGAGLGLLLHSFHTAALASGVMPSQTVSAERLSAVFADHVRLTHNRSMQVVRKKARPAMVDMFLHAGG